MGPILKTLKILEKFWRQNVLGKWKDIADAIDRFVAFWLCGSKCSSIVNKQYVGRLLFQFSCRQILRISNPLSASSKFGEVFRVKKLNIRTKSVVNLCNNGRKIIPE